jgi:hypothetical protein
VLISLKKHRYRRFTAEGSRFFLPPRLKPGAKCCRSYAAKHSRKQRNKTCRIPCAGNARLLTPQDCAAAFYQCFCKSLADASGYVDSLCFQPVDLPKSETRNFKNDVLGWDKRNLFRDCCLIERKAIFVLLRQTLNGGCGHKLLSELPRKTGVKSQLTNVKHLMQDRGNQIRDSDWVGSGFAGIAS